MPITLRPGMVASAGASHTAVDVQRVPIFSGRRTTSCCGGALTAPPGNVARTSTSMPEVSRAISAMRSAGVRQGGRSPNTV